MKNSVKIAAMAAVSLFIGAGQASSAIVLKSGGWRSGGQGASSGSITVKYSGISAALGSTKAQGGSVSVTGGLTSAVVTPVASASVVIHAYPVPYKPSLGHNWIKFAGLSYDAVIKIYDLSGRIVKTIRKSDASGEYQWNVRGTDGRYLSSGVYMYFVSTGGKKKTGRIMIIR